MAITALTWTYKKSPLTSSSYILMASATCTGDASGGGISETKDIGAMLPLNSIVTCLDSGWFQNDNGGRLLDCGIQSLNWEATAMNTIVATNPANVAEKSDGYWFSTDFMRVQKFPVYLGHNTTGNFNLTVGCDTNTNTKTYLFWFKFLIQMSQT